MENNATVEHVESTENNQSTQDIKNENDDLKAIIKQLELKIDAQQKSIDETNNKIKSFASDYMNKKHEEMKKEAESLIDDNDPSWEF